MGATRFIRRFRNLKDVTFGTPADGDVVQYDSGTDELIVAPVVGAPPTGAAGGDLTGTYPNPQIAAGAVTPAELSFDPATQAELAAHEADTTNVHGIADASVLATDAEVAAAVAAHEAAADPHAGYQKESEKGSANGYASLDGAGDVPDAQIPASITRDSEAVLDGDVAGGVLSGTFPNPGFAADMATQAELDALAAAAAAADAAVQASIDAHLADGTDAHDASAVSFVPAGSIAATNVQGAIEEVATEAAAGGAPNTADYLVGTAQGGLSAEIVVGASPGGELGGTWAAPTVDAVHSGSSHAQAQAAAEATAAAALAAHTTDATDAHDASAISILDAAGDFTAADVEGALVELIAGDDAIESDLADHLADAADAHDASAISVVPFGTIAATQVQAALEEIIAEASPGVTDHGALTGLADDDHPQYTLTAEAQALADATLATHTGDATDAHDASAISFVPAGTIAATDVQAAIEEVAIEAGGAGAPTGADYLVGTAQGGLSAEIVVGAAPGGELGGTWAAPTVDATHSGSSHAGVQAAAEATAQAALDAHTGDATDAHDASAISILDTAGDFTATEVEGALAELQTADEADEAALAAHLADASDAHDASAVSFSPTGTVAATDVQAAIAEVASEATSAGVGDKLALYAFGR